jgi:hypothetical protein
MKIKLGFMESMDLNKKYKIDYININSNFNFEFFQRKDFIFEIIYIKNSIHSLHIRTNIGLLAFPNNNKVRFFQSEYYFCLQHLSANNWEDLVRFSEIKKYQHICDCCKKGFYYEK